MSEHSMIVPLMIRCFLEVGSYHCKYPTIALKLQDSPCPTVPHAHDTVLGLGSTRGHLLAFGAICRSPSLVRRVLALPLSPIPLPSSSPSSRSPLEVTRMRGWNSLCPQDANWTNGSPNVPVLSSAAAADANGGEETDVDDDGGPRSSCPLIPSSDEALANIEIAPPACFTLAL